MNHTEFDWDFENITHIARHGITPEEAEEALLGPTMDVEHEDWRGESRSIEVGRTAMGRILQLTITMRGFRVRVVTAYDADRSAANQYFAQFGSS
jgi:uncharacterized DUF497 family protein